MIMRSFLIDGSTKASFRCLSSISPIKLGLVKSLLWNEGKEEKQWGYHQLNKCVFKVQTQQITEPIRKPTLTWNFDRIWPDQIRPVNTLSR